MTYIDKILDEKLDKILEKYAVDNFLQTGQVQAHIDAKEAIKQLIVTTEKEVLLVDMKRLVTKHII